MSIILRSYQGVEIPQRPDGYINATKMCRAGGKQWSNFRQLKQTEEYIEALESVLGIPRTDLILSIQGVPIGGDPSQQGTWVHPRLASRLAQWISAPFAVLVDGWVIEVMEGNHPAPVQQAKDDSLMEELRALMVISKNIADGVVDIKQVQKAHDAILKEEVLPTLNNHTDRLDKLEKSQRNKIPPRHLQIYKQVVWEFFNGNCPVFPHIKILESSNIIVQKNHRCIAEAEHWYGRYYNGLSECWLVSKEANQAFRNDASLRDKYDHLFKTFQARVDLVWEREMGKQLAII